jgi:hypothetical protein
MDHRRPRVAAGPSEWLGLQDRPLNISPKLGDSSPSILLGVVLDVLWLVVVRVVHRFIDRLIQLPNPSIFHSPFYCVCTLQLVIIFNSISITSLITHEIDSGRSVQAYVMPQGCMTR